MTIMMGAVEDFTATKWLVNVGVTVDVIGLVEDEDTIADVDTDEAKLISSKSWPREHNPCLLTWFSTFNASENVSYRMQFRE